MDLDLDNLPEGEQDAAEVAAEQKRLRQETTADPDNPETGVDDVAANAASHTPQSGAQLAVEGADVAAPAATATPSAAAAANPPAQSASGAAGGHSRAGSQNSAGQRAPRLQVTDILQVLARLLSKSQWETVQALVRKWRKTERPSSDNNKRSFISDLRDVVGTDLWRDTILEIQKSNSGGPNSGVRFGLGSVSDPLQAGSSNVASGATASPSTPVVALQTTKSLPLQPSADAKAQAPPATENATLQPPVKVEKSGENTTASAEHKRTPSVREVINAVKWLVTADQHATLDMLSNQYVKNQITQIQLEARLKGMVGHDGLMRAFTLATKNLGPDSASTQPAKIAQTSSTPQTDSKPVTQVKDAGVPTPTDVSASVKAELKACVPTTPAAAPGAAVTAAGSNGSNAMAIQPSGTPGGSGSVSKTQQVASQLARHHEKCSNFPQTQDTTCKLCRMWNYVKNMPGGQQQSTPSQSLPSNQTAVAQRKGHATKRKAADQEKIKQALRVKLREHFRRCPGCSQCEKWQEQLRKVKEKQRLQEQGAAAEAAKPTSGKRRTPKRPRKPDAKQQRLEGLAFEEGDWVTIKPKKGNTPGRLARVMQIDNKVQVEFVARLGDCIDSTPTPLNTAKVVLSFELVDPAQHSIQRLGKVPSYLEYPDIEPPRLQENFYVDYRSYGDTSQDGWWPAQVIAEGSVYTVKLEAEKLKDELRSRKLSKEEEYSLAAEAGRKAATLGAEGEAETQVNIKRKVRREQLRIVCGHKDCRQRQLRFELPQMWCIDCTMPVRYPGSTFYIAANDTLAADGKLGPSGPVQTLCKDCYKRAEKGQRSHRGGMVVKLNLAAMKEVTMPKEGQEGTGTDIGYNIGELLPWIQCSNCGRLYHQVCAMYNDRLFTLGWKCDICRSGEYNESALPYRYLKDDFTVKKGLSETRLSKDIEGFIRKELDMHGVDVARTPPVSVRVVSTLECFASPPESVRNRNWSLNDEYPKELPYTSRAIMAFQNQEGAEVAIFCMYVQEYGVDCPQPNKNRVYISYLDSVRYFTCVMKGGVVAPRHMHRTTVYHGFLLAYLQYVRDHGFTHVHIWVEPPKQFDEYIFFARPLVDRYTDSSNTMKRDKLRQWYVQMLEKAQAKGIVDSGEQGIQSLCDAFSDIKSAREIPLFKGDQWEFTLTELIDGKGRNQHQLSRQDSASLITGIKKAMRDHRDHFLVARLIMLKPNATTKKKKEPIISSHFTNSRDAFQTECVKQHWQFNNLRFAKYSTMMLVHYFISQPKPHYCIPNCKRGRIDDGYGMVCCEHCEQWFHYACVNITEERAVREDFAFVCIPCTQRQRADARAGNNHSAIPDFADFLM